MSFWDIYLFGSAQAHRKPSRVHTYTCRGCWFYGFCPNGRHLWATKLLHSYDDSSISFRSFLLPNIDPMFQVGVKTIGLELPGIPSERGPQHPNEAKSQRALGLSRALASRTRARLAERRRGARTARPTGGVSCPGQNCMQGRQALFVQFSPSPEARKAFLYTSSPIQKPASFLSLSSSSLSDDILSSRLARIKIPITPDMFNP